MSRCPECGDDVPDSQTLCQECWDARYAHGGEPKRSKSFREKLTGRNILLFLGVFGYGFIEFRFNYYFPFNPFGIYRHYVMPTETAVLTALVLASFAFYVESGRRR